MLDAFIGFDSVPLTLLEALSSFAFLRSFSRYYDTMYSWYYVLCTMYVPIMRLLSFLSF